MSNEEIIEELKASSRIRYSIEGIEKIINSALNDARQDERERLLKLIDELDFRGCTRKELIRELKKAKL